jgi:hypothetical protein
VRDGLDAKRWIITEQKFCYLLRAPASRGTVSLGVWFDFAFWRQFFASFAVKKNLPAKNAKDSQRKQSKSLRPKDKLKHYSLHFALAGAVDAKPAVILYSRMK